MILALLALAWYAVGALGSFLTLWFWWREELDVDGGDVILAGLLAFTGPINLAVGSIFFLMWAFRDATFLRRVLIRRREIRL